MARIKDTSVEAVKPAADFVAVVEERTPLRKQGARLVGRCPFHEERTPSFSVNPSLGLYHCFGCHKGGDMIKFVRDTQGLDFVGAIEWLAERFRIDARVRGRLARAGGEAQPPRAPARAARRRCDLLRAHALGDRGRLVRARLPRGPRLLRGDRARVPARARARRRLARRARRSRRASRATSCRRPVSCAGAGRTTSSGGSCSRSPTRAAACSASRRASSTTTTRCTAST